MVGHRCGPPGAIDLKIPSFRALRGLVFGFWAEPSEDMSWLIIAAVDLGVLRGRRAGAVAADDNADMLRVVSFGFLLRKWGMTALRANARLLLDKLAHNGRGSTAAVDRRQTA